MKSRKSRPESAVSQWLLLVLRFPSKPAYVRVKTWRRLRECGAVMLRNSVYALPRTVRSEAEFRKVISQIEGDGGEALLCDGQIIAGMTEADLQKAFNIAREADYASLAANLRGLALANKRRKSRGPELNLKLMKARQSLAAISEIDFFGAPGRSIVEGLLTRLEHSPIESPEGKRVPEPLNPFALIGKTWVTRQGIHVDRIACAWLIRRFIDPKARFKFVSDKKYRPSEQDIRFDMTNGEFTHEGDKCSFEVIFERMKRPDPALAAIAQIIHNLDIQDGKFDRPEAAGIGHVIEGICMNQMDDMERLARGAALFDDTYERFRRRRARQVA
jgi:hypothetical protein